MKKLWLPVMILIGVSVFLSGCSNNRTDEKYQNGYDGNFHDGYDVGYDEGYDEGYNEGYIEGACDNDYEEEYLEFQSTIITLMYDYEYETVEKMFEYYPEAVGNFLEQEFGTTDIPTIIDYLESERTMYPDTIVGKCSYCGEGVRHEDAVHFVSLHNPSSVYYAHQSCFDENNPEPEN